MRGLTKEANRLLILTIIGIISVAILASCGSKCNECGHSIHYHQDKEQTYIKTINKHSFLAVRIVKVCPTQ
jgi:hypothetical protein